MTKPNTRLIHKGKIYKAGPDVRTLDFTTFHDGRVDVTVSFFPASPHKTCTGIENAIGLGWLQLAGDVHKFEIGYTNEDCMIILCSCGERLLGETGAWFELDTLNKLLEYHQATKESE